MRRTTYLPSELLERERNLFVSLIAYTNNNIYIYHKGPLKTTEVLIQTDLNSLNFTLWSITVVHLIVTIMVLQVHPSN